MLIYLSIISKYWFYQKEKKKTTHSSSVTFPDCFRHCHWQVNELTSPSGGSVILMPKNQSTSRFGSVLFDTDAWGRTIDLFRIFAMQHHTHCNKKCAFVLFSFFFRRFGEMKGFSHCHIFFNNIFFTVHITIPGFDPTASARFRCKTSTLVAIVDDVVVVAACIATRADVGTAHFMSVRSNLNFTFTWTQSTHTHMFKHARGSFGMTPGG